MRCKISGCKAGGRRWRAAQGCGQAVQDFARSRLQHHQLVAAVVRRLPDRDCDALGRRGAMTAPAPAADLFETPTAVPDDVIIGLSLLVDRPPLWPITGPAWVDAVRAVRAFADRWHGEAA